MELEEGSTGRANRRLNGVPGTPPLVHDQGLVPGSSVPRRCHCQALDLKSIILDNLVSIVYSSSAFVFIKHI